MRSGRVERCGTGDRDGRTSIAGIQRNRGNVRALRNIAHGRKLEQGARHPQCDRWPKARERVPLCRVQQHNRVGMGRRACPPAHAAVHDAERQAGTRAESRIRGRDGERWEAHARFRRVDGHRRTAVRGAGTRRQDHGKDSRQNDERAGGHAFGIEEEISADRRRRTHEAGRAGTGVLGRALRDCAQRRWDGRGPLDGQVLSGDGPRCGPSHRPVRGGEALPPEGGKALLRVLHQTRSGEKPA